MDTERKAPEGVDRLTPQEAWVDGYRAGREELASRMQLDENARKLIDQNQTEAQYLRRLDDLERRLKTIADDSNDRARLVAELAQRIKRMEEGGA